MGLFDKKYCDVCGEKIGLFGNRKLENGNLCKNCANKLSYWFDDRRSSTVEQIKEQLAYREENKEKVRAFNTTRVLGRDTKVAVDEDSGTFIVVRTDNIDSENPDVLDFADVVGCDFDIDEDKTEIMREDKDGNEISYNPPRYSWDYDFKIVLHVKHPYFDEIEFDLNDSTVCVESTGVNPVIKPAAGVQSSGFNPRMHPEYLEYEAMGKEIKDLFTRKQNEIREQNNASNVPKVKVICPTCGAPTIPDANDCCEYCGCAVNK